MNWSQPYPASEGLYWFYGWSDRIFSKKNQLPPRMRMVTAIRDGNGSIMCRADGEYLFPNQALGLWAKIDAPHPPATDLFN